MSLSAVMTTTRPATEGTVLEPFAGSGTTLMVARWLGRKSIGIELSETYADTIAKERIETPKPAEKKPKRPRKKRPMVTQGELF